MIKQILLDMDGVVADFMGHALAYHGFDRELMMDKWPAGEWDAAKVLGITDKAFWAKIDSESFWDSVPSFKGAALFYERLCTHAPVTFATTPSYAAVCYSAKIRWLRFFIGNVKVMMGHQKWLMAKPEHLLIDDNDDNVFKFRHGGGKAVLVPRLWNADHTIAAKLRRSDDWSERTYELVLDRVTDWIL